tara:strand:- start:2294 stop:2620 length:327 start_codon:yes stop_codon:yes gene_type:complete
MDDVWAVADLIIEETNQANEEHNKSFDVAESLVSQIPFFACPSKFMDTTLHTDIERYTYCEKFNIPPYEGSYDEQPAKWIRRSFAIRAALAKKEKKEIDRVKQHNNKI